jgi:hypothetical protein
MGISYNLRLEGSWWDNRCVVEEPSVTAMAISPRRVAEIAVDCSAAREGTRWVGFSDNGSFTVASNRPFRREDKSVVQPIVAPEHLGPDKKSRGAEYASRARFVCLYAQARLDRLGLGLLENVGARQTQSRQNGGHLLRMIDIFDVAPKFYSALSSLRRLELAFSAG